MSIQHDYVEQVDEVCEDHMTIHYVPRPQPDHTTVSQRRARARYVLFGWPKLIGILQTVCGTITVLLGIIEVFLLPILEDKTGGDVLSHNVSSTCYGVALWSGSLLVITGCFALRATLSGRKMALYRFFIMQFVCLVVYCLAVGLLIKGYSSKATIQSSYPASSGLFAIHVLITSTVIFGLLTQLYTFIKYYEVILYGELALLERCVGCLMPCCCTRVYRPPYTMTDTLRDDQTDSADNDIV